MAIDNILRRLQKQEIVTPYLENMMEQDQWNDEYVVDTRPYYGLTDEDGNEHGVGVGDGFFHPGSHAVMSERELFYLFHPDYAGMVPSRRFSLGSMWSMAMGTAAHAIAQTLLHKAGLLHIGSTEWEYTKPGVRGRHPDENPYEWEYVDERHNLRGRGDGILHHPSEGRMIFEMKTMNPRSFSFLEEPLPKWELQTLLAADAYGVDEGVIVVLEMGYPWNMKEFRVKRRDSLLRPVYDKFDRVRNAIDRGEEPPRCQHGMGSPEARSCPLAHVCWSAD